MWVCRLCKKKKVQAPLHHKVEVAHWNMVSGVAADIIEECEDHSWLIPVAAVQRPSEAQWP